MLLSLLAYASSQPPLPKWYLSGHRNFKPLLPMARECWAEKMCESDSRNCSFAGNGVICGLERHAIHDIHTHLPPDAVVLELGARFGTVSCAISRRQRDSGLVVSVEPDPKTHVSLKLNMDHNGCKGIAVNGAVSQQRLFQYWRVGGTATGYGNTRVLPTNCTGADPYLYGARQGQWWCEPIERFTVDQLALMLSDRVGRSVHFSALVIDCEGCLRRFMEDERTFLDDPQLQWIFYETDERNASLVRDMCNLGFSVLSNARDCMTPAAPGLAQVVFKRNTPGETPFGCKSLWSGCDGKCKAACGLVASTGVEG